MGFLGGVVGAVVDTVSDTVSEGTSWVEETAGDAYEAASDGASWVEDTAGDLYDGASSVGESFHDAQMDVLGYAAGGISQAAGDLLETGANAVSPAAGESFDMLGIPGVGEIISGAQAGYHVGAGIYDGLTGDRDGAITHGVQGAFNVLGMVPGLSEGMGAIDMFLGPHGGFGKQLGLDAPQSLGDVASMLAVRETNEIFGADDTNLFGDETTPQGTRRGEIGAGILGLGPIAAPLVVAGNIRNFVNGKESANPGQGAGDLIGDLFHTPENARSLGAQPSAAQRSGQAAHREWSRLFGGLFD